VGCRPDGHTLDRIDTNGDYAPGNVRWATLKTQSNNRRNNILIALGDSTVTLSRFAELHGLDYSTVARRLQRGWPLSLLGQKVRTGARNKNASNA
jgi:hypothetical protein